jgi:hypothetical protein
MQISTLRRLVEGLGGKRKSSRISRAAKSTSTNSKKQAKFSVEEKFVYIRVFICS